MCSYQYTYTLFPPWGGGGGGGGGGCTATFCICGSRYGSRVTHWRASSSSMVTITTPNSIFFGWFWSLPLQAPQRKPGNYRNYYYYFFFFFFFFYYCCCYNTAAEC
jgi:hypothetical protein